MSFMVGIVIWSFWVCWCMIRLIWLSLWYRIFVFVLSIMVKFLMLFDFIIFVGYNFFF